MSLSRITQYAGKNRPPGKLQCETKFDPGYFSSTIIDGITYRVWKADNFGLGWRFIVLQMVNPTSMIKGSINFKNIFVYLKSAGLIAGQEYLSSIEFGNEMEEGTGDVLVKDFKAEVR